MDYHYAQLQDGKVLAVSTWPSMLIPVPSNNSKLLGTTFTGTMHPTASESDFVGFKSILKANKVEIAADNVETVTISITIKDWKDNVATTFNGLIKININGAKKDLTVTNGAASYVYKTNVVGIKAISTQDADGYSYISHGSVSVDAHGDLEEL